MHPRNIFGQKQPDFKELALKHPQFRQNCSIGIGNKISYNFHNPEAIRILTEVLLREYFQLNVSLPKNSLVPRVPQRLNYILLIEDLLIANNLNKPSGIDIGTGASCIFPLLGAKIYSWRFVATEINHESMVIAIQNVKQNDLCDKIQIVHSKESFFEAALSLNENQNKSFSFSMCNPPFFDPEENDNVQ